MVDRASALILSTVASKWCVEGCFNCPFEVRRGQKYKIGVMVLVCNHIGNKCTFVIFYIGRGGKKQRGGVILNDIVSTQQHCFDRLDKLQLTKTYKGESKET